MKKNLFISCALIVLAVLAGCAPQSNYPAFPQSVVLTQKGDFIKGQDFDASKFEVVVKYLDGSQQTLQNAAIVYTDNGSKGVSSDDTVSINVGKDYNGNDVKTDNVNISKVYTIDSLSVKANETVTATGNLESGATGVSSEYTVTATYNGGSTMVLPASSYSVTVKAVDPDAEDYVTATSVPAIAEIALTGNIGTANSVKGTAEVTVSKTAGTIPSGAVEEVTAFSGKTSFKFAAMTYEALPEIDRSAVKFTVTVDAEESSAELSAEELGEDLVLTYVNKNGFAITDFESIDFAGKAADSESGIFLHATWKGEAVGDDYQVKVAGTSITVEYKGAGFEAGAKKTDAELAINPDDFRVVLTVGDVKTDITKDVEFYIADKITNLPSPTEQDKEVSVTVSVNYNGVTDVTGVSVPCVSPATIKAVTFDVTGLTGPAKQILTAVPTVDVSKIKNLKVEMTSGTSALKATDFEWAYYTKPSDDYVELALSNGVVDLSSVDSLYVGATYKEKTYYSTATVATVAATAATGIELVADWGDAAYYEAPVTFKVNTVNADGVVNEVESGYAIYKVEGSKSEKVTKFPTTLKEAASYKVAYVLDDQLVESNVVEIPAGTPYFVKGETVTATYKGGKLYISDPLNTVKAEDFEISGFTYVGEGTAPAIKASSVTVVGGETVAADNTVYLTVKYTDKTLKEQTETITVTGVTGTAWVEGESSSATLKYGNALLSTTSGSGTEIPAGTYTWDDFTSSLKEHGAEVTFTATGIAGTFTPASNGFSIEQYADGSITMTWTNKTGEQSKTFYVHGGAAPAEEA